MFFIPFFLDVVSKSSWQNTGTVFYFISGVTVFPPPGNVAGVLRDLAGSLEPRNMEPYLKLGWPYGGTLSHTT